MSISHVLCFFAGLLIGIGHATSLWRSTARVGRFGGAGVILRLILVAAALLVAAIAALILPVAGGWAIGFPVAAGLLARRTSAGPRPHGSEAPNRKESTGGISSLR